MAVWFVTGTARRFGAELVRQAAARGHQVVATARHPERIATGSGAGEVFPVALDVTDEEQARTAVEQAVDRFGRLDVLVNSAALVLVGAVEEASAAEVRDCYDTNVFGPVERRAGGAACHASPAFRVGGECQRGRRLRQQRGVGRIQLDEVRD